MSVNGLLLCCVAEDALWLGGTSDEGMCIWDGVGVIWWSGSVVFQQQS